MFLEQDFNIQSEILNKAKLGEMQALEWLYKKFSKGMYSICVRMLGNKPEADDVLQDVFVIAFKNLHQLKDAQAFAGWIKRITVNECIRFSKKQFYYDGWEDERFEHLVDDDEEHWWLGININAVQKAIKNLPDGCRQVFNLFALEDYSHKQIAENLGISESTSKSQYYRAKQLLKQRLTQEHYG